MIALLRLLLAILASPFKSKCRLEAENVALRHQLIVLRRQVRGRVRLTNFDRLFLVQLCRWFPSILKALAIVQPETVIRWHRAGFRCYWRWKSRSRGGRPRIETELRILIRQMSIDNPLWVHRASMENCSSWALRSPSRRWPKTCEAVEAAHSGLAHLSAEPCPSPASGAVWQHVWVTVEEAISGFFIAVVLGMLFGTLLAKVKLLEMALKPFIIALQLVPKIALVPLFILWFGFGIESKVVISATLAFFPIFANALIGFKSVDRGDCDLFVSMQATPLATFWLLDLPSALPVILTGAEVGIVLAIIGAVVGEFMGGNVGLGYLAVAKLQDLKVSELFSVILLLTLIGLTLYMLVAALRRWLTPWHDASDVAI